MGKRIISQARGKGSLTYQAKKSAFQYKVKYPMTDGEAEIADIIHSAGHSAPLIKAVIGGSPFYYPAFNGAVVGQKIIVNALEVKDGNIMMLKNVPTATRIYNIERHPGDGGKMIRTAGSSAAVAKVYEHNKKGVLMPNKKEIVLSGDCRVTIGRIAGDGKVNKPFVKAGAMFYKMKARNKLWPRTSAIKMNAIDHPFGSGRGKRPKPKIAKRNAPPGRRVGHIRPSRTGHKR